MEIERAERAEERIREARSDLLRAAEELADGGTDEDVAYLLDFAAGCVAAARGYLVPDGGAGRDRDPLAAGREIRTHLGEIRRAVAVGVLRNHIAGLGRALVTAKLALAGLDPDTPAGDDDPLTALFEARPDVARKIRDHVLGKIPKDRPRRGALRRVTPLAAAAAWIAADGSAGRAAETLGCHRNTVLNGLREFETLTGLTLSRTGDLFDVTLALRAHEFLDGAR